MGNINFGNQNLTFKYRQPSNSESFNNLLHNILPSGIYSGGSLSIISDSIARVNPVEVLISDIVSEVTIKCATSLSVDVSVSDVAPYIVMRLEWENTPNNYVDFLSVAFENLRDTDIILGKAVYIGTVFSSIDYSTKSLPSFEKSGYDLVIDSNQKLLDWASGVYDSKCRRVFIKSGIWILDSGNIDLLARGTDIIDCQEGAVIHFANISSTLNLATGITYGGTDSPVFTSPYENKRISNLKITGSNGDNSQIVAGFFNCVNLFNCKSELTSDIGINQFKYCINLNNCFSSNNNSTLLVSDKNGFSNCKNLLFCISEGLDNTTGYVDCTNIYTSNFISEGIENLIGLDNCSNIFSSEVILPNSDTTSIGFNNCSNMFYSSVVLNEVVELQGIDFNNCSSYLEDVNETPNSRVVRDTDGSILANEGSEENNVTVNSQLVPIKSFKGWDSSYPYSLNEPTFYNGVPYRSLSHNNEGNAPDISPLSWEVTGGGGGDVTTDPDNTAVGYQSLYSNTTGFNNTAVGSNALFTNTVGSYNTAVGYQSLQTNTTGDSNTALGTNALRINTTGSYNTAVGINTLYSNTTGSNNTAIGIESLQSNTFGSHNTAVGNGAGSTNTYGSNNTFLGVGANGSTATTSNQITLGNNNITSLRCAVTTITALSDRRDKKNIEKLEIGLDFVRALNPCGWNYDLRENYPDGKADGSKMKKERNHGFIAQDLQKIQKDFGVDLGLVLEDNPDKLETSEGRLFPVLVKAVQELADRLEKLEGVK